MGTNDQPQTPNTESVATDRLAFLAACRSDEFLRVLEIARKLAPYDTAVLLRGETGVGKEVVARYIHAFSPRADRQLLFVNCGALPETLLESEMFGHKAGSFTGAISDRVGLFEQAARGTIVLDEIGEISPAVQVKILRVLQEREITRVGESIPRRIDTRIIAATNRDLGEAVAKGRFREDLLYRLRVIELEIPPLRKRREDIIPLAEFFAVALSRRLGWPSLRFLPDCLSLLQRHNWPGNARELQNAIERAAVLGGDGVIRAEHLPTNVLAGTAKPLSGGSVYLSLREVELQHIETVLAHTAGNREQACRILGISKTTLWRKLKAARRARIATV